MWVDVKGGRLYMQESGKGSPILLIHGWPLDHRIFEPQVACFSRVLRVVAFDRRGFGRSRVPPGLGREPDDIERILDALSVDAVHLLGMSQGARIALRFAVTRPERIRSLLLQGPAVDGLVLEEPDRERIPIREFAALARAGKMDEVRQRWLAHPMMALGRGHARQRRLLETILADYEGADLLGAASGETFFSYSHDVLSRLGRMDVPTLILTGAHETSTRREHARKLLNSIPGCREIEFADSGHLSNLTEVERYNQAVVDFCAAVEKKLRTRALD